MMNTKLLLLHMIGVNYFQKYICVLMLMTIYKYNLSSVDVVTLIFNIEILRK